MKHISVLTWCFSLLSGVLFAQQDALYQWAYGDSAKNVAALSDAEFLASLDKALSQSMEAFIVESIEQDEQYLEHRGKKRADDDAQEMRAQVKLLSEAVQEMYRAHMQWFECAYARDGVLYTEAADALRCMLRERVVNDMRLLIHPDIFCLWAMSDAENIPADAEARFKCSPCEASLMEVEPVSHYSCRCLSVLRLRESNKNTFFQIFCELMQDKYEIINQDAESDSSQLKNSMEEMEEAWTHYLEAMKAAHTPVFNSWFSGTGTGDLIVLLEMDMLAFRQELLRQLLMFEPMLLTDEE